MCEVFQAVHESIGDLYTRQRDANLETILIPVIVQLFSPLHCQSAKAETVPRCQRHQQHQVKIKTHPSSSLLPFYYLCTCVWFTSFHSSKCQNQFSQLMSIRSQACLCLLSGFTEFSRRNRFSNYSNDKIFLLLVTLVKPHICFHSFCMCCFQ